MNFFESTQKYVEGKIVFCGIDIHKVNWSLCYFCDGEIVEKLSIPGEVGFLLRHTKQQYRTARSVRFVYEAGFFYIGSFRQPNIHA